MKTKELRALSVDDLVKKEQDVREDLFKLRFQHSGPDRKEEPVANHRAKNSGRLYECQCQENPSGISRQQQDG